MKLLRNLSLIIAMGACLYSCIPSKVSEEVVKETYIHKYGVTIPKKEWISRGGDGQVITKYQDGIIAAKDYDNGLLQGKSTYTFPNSATISQVDVYDKDSLVSETFSYLSGAPKYSSEFFNNNEKRVSRWYEEGSPQSVEMFLGAHLVTGEYFTLNNEIESQVTSGTGICTERNGYGSIVSRKEIFKGMITLETRYYNTGDPKTITPYRDGEIEGTRQHFFMGGVPQRTEEWAKGQQHGTTVVFHNGEKQKEIPYKNGIIEGVEKRFANGATIVAEISWKDNKRHGPTNIYSNGEVHTEWFYNDHPVKDVVSTTILSEVYK
jgi:antitoxin component YwqK of YwqJK toxin-antitoxin module